MKNNKKCWILNIPYYGTAVFNTKPTIESIQQFLKTNCEDLVYTPESKDLDLCCGPVYIRFLTEIKLEESVLYEE